MPNQPFLMMPVVPCRSGSTLPLITVSSWKTHLPRRIPPPGEHHPCGFGEWPDAMQVHYLVVDDPSPEFCDWRSTRQAVPSTAACAFL